MKKRPGHPAPHAPPRLRHRLLDPHRFARQERVEKLQGKDKVEPCRAQCQNSEVSRAETGDSQGRVEGLVHKDDKADCLGPSRRKTAQHCPRAKEGRTAAQDIQDRADRRWPIPSKERQLKRKKTLFRRMTDCLDDLIRVLQRHHHLATTSWISTTSAEWNSGMVTRSPSIQRGRRAFRAMEKQPEDTIVENVHSRSNDLSNRNLWSFRTDATLSSEVSRAFSPN